MRSGQPGSLSGQCTRPGTALQLAPAHHRAYRRQNNKEPAHPLRPSILGQHQAHAATYVNTRTRDAQDNDMFYYFLSDSLTNEFRTTVLLYVDVYTVTNVPVAASLLKQIIILTRVDNPASTMRIREMLIESKW